MSAFPLTSLSLFQLFFPSGPLFSFFFLHFSLRLTSLCDYLYVKTFARLPLSPSSSSFSPCLLYFSWHVRLEVYNWHHSLSRLDLSYRHSDCPHLQQRMQRKADRHACVCVCVYSATLIVLTTSCRLGLKRNNIFKHLFLEHLAQFKCLLYTW